MLKHIYQLATCYIYRIMQPAEGGRCRFCCRLVKRGARSFRTTNSLLIFTDHIYIILDQQTGRKKRLFWSMTLFLANWPILGQIGQFNPKRPKMAEIWLKSNFLCVSMVSQSHNFTFFHHSYTCSTDWPLTCLTGSMGPALSGLSLLSAFSFILRRVGALFRDWMPIGINFNAVWHVLFRFWLANLYHLRQLCVCLRVGLHAYDYLIGVIHNTYPKSLFLLNLVFG